MTINDILSPQRFIGETKQDYTERRSVGNLISRKRELLVFLHWLANTRVWF